MQEYSIRRAPLVVEESHGAQIPLGITGEWWLNQSILRKVGPPL